MEESGSEKSIDIKEPEHATGAQKRSFLHPVFLNSGKFAAEIRGLSRKTADLVSQKCALLNIKKGYLAKKLLHTDVLYFRKSVEFKPQSADTNYNLAEALLKDKRFNEAALYFKRTTFWDFHNIKAYHGMAGAYQKLGQNDQAIEALQKGLTYNDKNASLHYALGAAYEQNGSINEAGNSYKHAIASRKDFKEALDALTSLKKNQSALLSNK